MRLICSALLLLSLLASAVAAAGPLTRGDLAAALWARQGSPAVQGASPFSDVPPEDPCAPAVAWALEQGLVRGTGGGRFSPGQPATREEAAVLLRRYARWLGQDAFYPEIARCNDYEDISPWADDSLYWAAGTGVLPWSPGGRLDPQGPVAQADLAAALDRLALPPPVSHSLPRIRKGGRP